MTKDEIPDPQKLQIRLSNNGTLMQNFNTSDMAHKIPRAASSGCPRSTPWSLATSSRPAPLRPPRAQPVRGQRDEDLELEIEGIGRLFAFNVKDELKRTWERRTRLQMHERAAAKNRRCLSGHHAAIDRQARAGRALISDRTLISARRSGPHRSAGE